MKKNMRKFVELILDPESSEHVNSLFPDNPNVTADFRLANDNNEADLDDDHEDSIILTVDMKAIEE